MILEVLELSFWRWICKGQRLYTRIKLNSIMIRTKTRMAKVEFWIYEKLLHVSSLPLCTHKLCKPQNEKKLMMFWQFQIEILTEAFRDAIEMEMNIFIFLLFKTGCYTFIFLILESRESFISVIFLILHTILSESLSWNLTLIAQNFLSKGIIYIRMKAKYYLSFKFT